MAADESEYEKRTRKLFWLGPLSYFRWRDFHRARYKDLETALVLDLVDAGVGRQMAAHIVGKRIRECL